MQLVTWNVNGLRAVFRKGAWTWTGEAGPDVICLQEIKARPDQLSAADLALFDGYHPEWNPAERPGYSGVVTLYRQPPLETILGLGDPRLDSEGRLIQSRFEDFRLFNVYFPNGKRDQERLDYKLDFYAALLDLCDDLHAKGENLVICGDFNTAHNEIDLAHPKANETVSGFLPEERAWIDKYLDHGFVDVFRQRNPEVVQYTWWSQRSNARAKNVGWRLDYFLVSEGFLPSVKDTLIHDDLLGSDHCPVSLHLNSL